jgi:hypothetical protein
MAEANGRFEETRQDHKTTRGDAKYRLKRGRKEEVPPPVVTDTQAKQARETLNDMGYGVYASGEGAEPEEKLSEKVKLSFRTLISLLNALTEKRTCRKLPKSSRALTKCGQPNGTTWNCGKAYSKQMSALLRPSQ